MDEIKKAKLERLLVERNHRRLFNASDRTEIECLRNRIIELEEKHNKLIEYLINKNESKN